jgi:hypothetical protein
MSGLGADIRPVLFRRHGIRRGKRFVPRPFGMARRVVYLAAMVGIFKLDMASPPSRWPIVA